MKQTKNPPRVRESQRNRLSQPVLRPSGKPCQWARVKKRGNHKTAYNQELIFLLKEMQFHLSTILAETHSFSQNREGPGKPPRGKNLDQKRVGDVWSLPFEG